MLRKICGMARQCDLDYAAQLGFDLCGFVFHEPSPRYIPPGVAARLHSRGMKRVGVFTWPDSERILACMKKARLNLAQLHGRQPIETALTIGPERIIRVIWPEGKSPKELQREIDAHADSCAFFLVDGGKSGGGSGLKVDWQILGQLEWPRPWILAGGLSPDCMAEAIQLCHPDGIDVNSGVETRPAEKNHQLMEDLAHILNKEKI